VGIFYSRAMCVEGLRNFHKFMSLAPGGVWFWFELGAIGRYQA
jgi:hypothetical protein